MDKIRLIFSAILVLGLAPAAQAILVTVEPDHFADGSDISNAVAGVALSVVGGGGGPVFARTDGAASTGTRSFGNSAASGVIAERIWFEGPGFNLRPPGPGPVLRADFAALTSFVAIDIINQDSFDGGILRAFDVNGVEIGIVSGLVTSQFGPAPGPQELSFSTVTPLIAWITVAGVSAQDSVHLDNLRFERAVPEPATSGLVLLALTMAPFVRRRV